MVPFHFGKHGGGVLVPTLWHFLRREDVFRKEERSTFFSYFLLVRGPFSFRFLFSERYFSRFSLREHLRVPLFKGGQACAGCRLSRMNVGWAVKSLPRCPSISRQPAAQPLLHAVLTCDFDTGRGHAARTQSPLCPDIHHTSFELLLISNSNRSDN